MSAAVAGWVVKNDPLGALNYRCRLDEVGGTTKTGYLVSTEYGIDQYVLELTFGNVYDTINHGISVTLVTRSPDPAIPGDTGSYTITLHFASAWGWGADTTLTGSSYDTTDSLYLYIDGLHLTGADCDSWAVAFTEIRFYESGVLKATLAGNSASGTGFDPRLCSFSPSWSASANPQPTVPPGVPSCTGTFGGQPAGTLSVTGLGTYGWQFFTGGVWTGTPIDIGVPTPVNHGDCDACRPILPNVSYTNSWDQAYSTELYFDDIVVDKGNQNCVCDDGLGTPAVRHFWTIARNYRYNPGGAVVVRKDAPMRTRYQTITEHCDGIDYADANTISDPWAVSLFNCTANRAYYFRTCSSSVSPGFCTIGVGSTCPSYGPDVTCDEEIGIQTTWPTKPPCSDAIKGVWNLTTRDGRWLESFADGIGAKVKWWDYHLPKGPNAVVTIDANTHYYQCRVYDDNRLRIYAVISKDDGTAYRSYSDSGGKEWSALTAIGISNPWWVTGAGNDGGDVAESAFVYDSGTSGPGVIKCQFKGSGDHTFGSIHTLKDSSGSNLKFSPTSFHLRFGRDGAARMILVATIDGETSPSEWWSTDFASGGMSFTRWATIAITGGIFPTGCGNQNNEVIEAAFVYDAGTSGPGKIKFVFKGSGDHSFGSVLTAKDSTGTALEFLATSFHIRFAKDGAARVILTAVINGETDVSSWWSTDVASGGGTFTRFP